MKRILCLLTVVLLLACTLVGCGEDDRNRPAPVRPATNAVKIPSKLPGSSPTLTTTEQPTTTTTATTTTKPTTSQVYTYNLLGFDSTFDMTGCFNAANGVIPVDLLVIYGIYNCDYDRYLTGTDEYGMTFYYTIPEDVVWQTMRRAFVLTDGLIAEVKEQGSYTLNGPDSATYENGSFIYEMVDGWGGPGVSSVLMSLTDNKDGTLTAKYQLFDINSLCGQYIVTYTYDGTANYTVNRREAILSSTDKAFIDSLCVLSVQEDLS